MKKVLVLGDVRSEGLEIVGEFADLTILPEPAPKDDILDCITDMDAVFHKIGRIDADIIARQTKLQIIARHGVGLDYLDLAAIKSAGIPVSITPQANSNAVAEATIGLVLNLIRHISRGDEMLKRDRNWARETLMGRELRHSIVGLLGYGRIGRLVANYFSAFGAEIIVYDSVPTALEHCHFPTVTLEELMQRADIISLHCPLNADTRHLINRDLLALARPGAVIINTSRGGLIDADALAEAAQSGKIGGAAIDVFDREPPNFDDPIFRCANILTTPHIAAMTTEAQTAMAVGAATEIRRVLVEKTQPSNNVLDRL